MDQAIHGGVLHTFRLTNQSICSLYDTWILVLDMIELML